jgi:hypothetical protein
MNIQNVTQAAIMRAMQNAPKAKTYRAHYKEGVVEMSKVMRATLRELQPSKQLIKEVALRRRAVKKYNDLVDKMAGGLVQQLKAEIGEERTK